MHYDLYDTIVAIASPPGGAARGVIRLSGPNAVAAASAVFFAEDASRARPVDRAHVRTGRFEVALADRRVEAPARLLLWPTTRSYTRQPSAEIHSFGSPPLLAALVEQLCQGDVRLARPGEFTLRAFLAGRIDLAQAEAVLAVIDADDRRRLHAALAQLAGGLSRPLAGLREQLLTLLAELEAGLDFADEDIEFISRDALQTQLAQIAGVVADAIAQAAGRGARSPERRAVLVGPTNVGKSSLFNALVERYGGGRARAIVSPVAGTTRDYLEARLQVAGHEFWLVDSAGEQTRLEDDVAASAQSAMFAQREQADLRIHCYEAGTTPPKLSADDLAVATKSDLHAAASAPDAPLACSSVTAVGVDRLAVRLAEQLQDRDERQRDVGDVSARAMSCLHDAAAALARAGRLADSGGGDELLAAEIRAALDRLGELVGAVYTDDVLDRIFGQFCIGK